MKQLVYIFFGSGLGGLTRYGIGKWISTFYTQLFPIGTFVTNLLACFILGVIIGLADYRQIITSDARLFWVVGFCGGFSTFSTFSGESMILIQSGQLTQMLLYIILTVFFCLLATFCGLFMVKMFL